MMSRGGILKSSVSQLLKYLQKERLYSTQKKGGRIGSKLESKDDINALLRSNKWDGQELLQNSKDNNFAKSTTKLPSDDEIYKLLKLSGLSHKNIDLEEIKVTLSNQIQFIDLLQNVSLTEEELKYNTNNARLLPRNVKPLKYVDLLKLIKTQKKNKQKSEISGYWNPTSLATKSVNNYFILEKGLLKNRK